MDEGMRVKSTTRAAEILAIADMGRAPSAAQKHAMSMHAR